MPRPRRSGAPHRGARTRVAVALGIVVSVVVTLVGVAVPASAVEGYGRPAGATIALKGHGYGHGHGMSQWGAYGAASSGLTWQQIMAFYYPGTALSSSYGNPTIRVQLRILGTVDTKVVPGTQLDGRAADGSPRTYTLGSEVGGTAIAAWRAYRPTGQATLVLERRLVGSSSWVTDGALRNTPYDMVFSHPADDIVRVVLPSGALRDYRGPVTTAISGSAIVSINRVPMNTYLNSVVPSEMPASWATEALRSQAVAARTYAAFDRASKPGTALYDTCDTTACQVYSGKADYTSSGTLSASHEFAASTNAVTSTSGRVVTYAGSLAFTQFSAANGGWMAAGSQPYLAAKADPYDGVHPSNAHDWTASISVASLQSQAGVGTYQRMQFISRDGHGDFGGRALTVRIVGSTGNRDISGETFRSWFGLKSTWFVPTTAPAVSSPAFPRDVTDDLLADVTAVDSAGKLLVFKGTGTPATPFASSPVTGGGGWGTLTMVRSVGPFDPDNRGDLVGRRSNGTLWLYPGSSTGAFTQAFRQIGSGWNAIDTIAAPGDWNGDKHNDLLGRETSTGRLWLYPGTGDGALGKPRVVGTGWGSMKQILATGDFTGDGIPDVLALKSSNVLYVYPGNGTGGWLAPKVVTAGFGAFDSLVGPGDVTGDGATDLLARRKSDGAMILYAGTGLGGVRSGTPVLSGWNAYPTVVQ